MGVESGPFPTFCEWEWKVEVVEVASEVAKNGSGHRQDHRTTHSHSSKGLFDVSEFGTKYINFYRIHLYHL